MIFHIIIPVHNRIELTRKCLTSLQNQTLPNFVVYIIDDGSIDNTSQIVNDEFNNKLKYRIYRGDGNLWWTGAIKMGVENVIKQSKDEDYIMTLNNDVTLTPDFIEKSEKIINRYPNSMIGGISVDSTDRQTIVATGWRMILWPLAITKRVWWPGKITDLKNKTPIEEIDFLSGTATLVPVNIVQKFGTVNPEILPHYHADSEYSYRLKKNGIQILLARDLVVYHNIETTGILSNTKSKPTISELLQSFTSIKSGNCLRYKWNFAKACCPKWALIPFIIFDTLKIMIRSIGILIIGERIDTVRSWLNF